MAGQGAEVPMGEVGADGHHGPPAFDRTALAQLRTLVLPKSG